MPVRFFYLGVGEERFYSKEHYYDIESDEYRTSRRLTFKCRRESDGPLIVNNAEFWGAITVVFWEGEPVQHDPPLVVKEYSQAKVVKRTLGGIYHYPRDEHSDAFIEANVLVHGTTLNELFAVRREVYVLTLAVAGELGHRLPDATTWDYDGKQGELGVLGYSYSTRTRSRQAGSADADDLDP